MKILIFILTLGVFSCSKKDAVLNNKMETLKQNCYSDRKVESQISNTSGKIIVINDQLHIQIDESTRYLPCELPAEYKEGSLIKFSGDLMKVHPNERWTGTPIHMTHISPLNQ
jgi:hypothetical protein